MSDNQSNPNPDHQLKEIGKTIASPIEAGVKTVQFLKQLNELAIFLALGLLNLATYPIELCLHQTFGLRFLKGRILVFSLIAMAITTSISLPFIGAPLDPRWLVLMVFGFVIQYSRQCSRAWNRHRSGIEVHSQSTSNPFSCWLRVPFVESQWAAMKWAEPVFILGLGLCVRVGFGMSFGSYLMIVAFALHCKIKLFEERELNRFLDSIDQKIESEAVSEAMEGRQHPEAETRGWIVPIPVPDAMVNTDTTVTPSTETTGETSTAG